MKNESVKEAEWNNNKIFNAVMKLLYVEIMKWRSNNEKWRKKCERENENNE